MSVSFFLVSSIIILLQVSGWAAGQVNITMCFWANPRGLPPSDPQREETNDGIVAVVRDSVYIDGGFKWSREGMADGTYGAYILDGMRSPAA